MRVLLVTTSYPLRRGAVSGIFIARLARALAGQHQVTVLVPSAEGASSPPPEPGGVRVVAFRYAPRALERLAHAPGGIPVALKRNPMNYLLVPFFLAAMFLSCLRLARKADVIHANWAICGLVAGVAGRLAGRPVLVTLRGEDVGRMEKGGGSRWVVRACLRLCHEVVGVSEAIVRQLRTIWPGASQRISLVENGVEKNLLAIVREVGPASPCRFLMMGSLIPRKRVDVAIDAMARVEGATLTIVGDGPERAALEERISRLGLDQRVALVGSRSPDELTGLLREHDVLLLTSRSEGRPNVVLEAMAAAMPVVASDIDGVRELVRDGKSGLLFAEGEVEALADCIRRLCGRPGLIREMGAQGRAFILRRGLLWRETAARYTRCYQRIAGESR